jgi:hypothetical protein
MKIKNIKRILKEETKGERYLNSKLSNMGPMGISRQISNLGGYGQIDTLKKAEEEFYKLHRVEFKLNNQKYEGYFIVYPQSDNTLIFYDGLPFAKKRDTMYTGGELNKDKSVIFTGSRVDLQLLKTYQNFLKRFNLKSIVLKGFPDITEQIKKNIIVDVKLFFEQLYNLFIIKNEFYKEIDDFINIFTQLKKYPKNSRLNRNVIDKYTNFRNNFVNSNVLENNIFNVFNSYNVDEAFNTSDISGLYIYFNFIKNNIEEIRNSSSQIIKFLENLSNKNSTRISQPFISSDKYDVSYIVNVKNNLLPGVKSELKNQILEFTYISENLIDKSNYKMGKSLGVMKINGISLNMRDKNDKYEIIFDAEKSIISLTINGNKQSGSDRDNSLKKILDNIFIQKFNGEFNYINTKLINDAINNKMYNFNYIENNNRHYRLGRSGAPFKFDILFYNDLDGTMFKGKLPNINIISLQINDFKILKEQTTYIDEIKINIEFISTNN